MKRVFIVGLMLLTLVLGQFATIAQDEEMTSFDFENSDASISFPEDWEAEVDENGALMLSADDVEMMVFDATTIADTLDVEDAETAEDMLASITDLLPAGIEIDVDDAKAVELDEREVLRLTFEEGDEAGIVIIVPLADETFGLVIAMMASDADETVTTMVDDVVASFDIVESTASGEACTINTSSSNTVQVRVGPGTNRTVIAFLPANIDFAAQGQTTDDDGNVWFRVPETEAAPGKAVNETWVAGADVDQSGDCENVEGAVAPPIIPIRQQQPTAVPQPSSDTTTDTTTTDATTTDTTDAPSAPAVDASGSIIPNPGTWFLSYDIGTIACSNGSGTYDSGLGTETAQLSGGGSEGIFYDGFIPFVGNNTYEVSETFSSPDGTITGRFTMTITSPNTATGSFGFVIQDCNVFIPFTVNRIG